MAARLARGTGFSVVELLVAMGLALSILASAITLVRAVQFAFMREGERADMQQRLRVAGNTLYEDLLMAGAGTFRGVRRGALGFSLPPVLPFRHGAQGADAGGAFRNDTLTIVYVPRATSAQAVVRAPVAAGSGLVPIVVDAGCPVGAPACGFAAGMQVIVFNQAAAFDLYTVMSVQGDWLDLRHDMVDTTFVYPAGTAIAEVVNRTFYLKPDAATGTSRLMRYDGSGSDVAMVDHVVSLSFAYYGDPDPPAMIQPASASVGPWTTYGPEPPPVGTQPTQYPPGENCTFHLDSNGVEPIARLPSLGSGSLVELTPGRLTDGPWCPDSASPRRYDADLFRIRRIDVALRVESATSALRGPAGPLFTRAGTARDGERWLPDLEVHFSVAPRNLSGGR